MNKLLTIVVPTYNMEKYLRRCLDSLIIEDKNLFMMLEVLVVNDGSKDFSSSIAHEYENKYPDVFRVIDKENGNYGSCVNRGVKEASGKYIKILDADDYFITTEFYLYLNKLETCNVDLILTDFKIVDESYNEIKLCTCSIFRPFQTILIKGKYFPLQMHQVTYKTSNLREIGYRQTEGVSYTDREWVFWPLTSVKTICYMPFVLYSYLIGRDGQTVDKKVYIRSVEQEVTITMNMIFLWSKNKTRYGDAETYINRFLCERMKYLVLRDIMEFKSENQNIFIEMDKRIKAEYPEFYLYSSDHCYLGHHYPYKYLKKWRKHYNLSHNNIFIKIYSLLNHK